jgi:hypothetical protein
MPGIGDEIDGAVQHAPQAGRQDGSFMTGATLRSTISIWKNPLRRQAANAETMPILPVIDRMRQQGRRRPD